MKKLVMFCLIFCLLLASFSFIHSADDGTGTDGTNTDSETTVDPVDLAFSCLNDRVSASGCASLSPVERAFVYATIGKCYSEIRADNISTDDYVYWSLEDGSNIKTTAITTLALSGSTDTTPSEDWLLSQTMHPSNVEWFLQVDADDLEEGTFSSCTVTYNGDPYTFHLNADKTITSLLGGGSCLSISGAPYNGLFLKVSNTNQACLDYEYTVSCDSPFLVGLIFKKQGENVIHITKGVERGSADESKSVTIDSLCFKQGSSCDYEGTLWASFALQSTHDISPFLPYLILEADDPAHANLLPESFLYSLTTNNQYYSDLMSRKNDQHGYWPALGNIFTRYYNTAVAGLSLSSSDLVDTKDWLFEDQGEDGCWGTNLDTAFLLYSLFGSSFSSSGCLSNSDCGTGYVCESGSCVPDEGTVTESCSDMDGFCMSFSECLDVGLEWSYSCEGAKVCCSNPLAQETCSEKGGTKCNLGETCLGGTSTTTVTDITNEQTCCIGGDCQVVTPPEDTCSDIGGECKLNCDESAGEMADDNAECTDYGDSCCVVSDTPRNRSLWWIWVLLALIVLVLIGFVFRNQLRMFWMRMRSGRGSGSSRSSSGRPPGFGSGPRHILPPSSSRRPSGPRPAPPRPAGDVDDVLKKLRDMGS